MFEVVHSLDPGVDPVGLATAAASGTLFATGLVVSFLGVAVVILGAVDWSLKGRIWSE